MKRFLKVLKSSYLSVLFFFLYMPVLYLIIYSFNDFTTKSGRVSFSNLGKWNGFTLANYSTLFTGDALDSIFTTLEIAIISSIVATIIGTAAAIGIQAMRKRSRTLVLNVSQLPMVNPDLVTGITFMMLFAFVNSILTKMSMDKLPDMLRLMVAHISFSIPYVIFAVLPRLKQSSDMLYEAAMDLGCTPIQAMLKAVIPDIFPGITSGFIMAFTMSLDDFVVSYFAGTGENSTLSVYIYSAATKGSHGVNPALATIIFIPLVALLLTVNIMKISKERKYEIQNSKVRLKNGGK